MCWIALIWLLRYASRYGPPRSTFQWLLQLTAYNNFSRISVQFFLLVSDTRYHVMLLLGSMLWYRGTHSVFKIQPSMKYRRCWWRIFCNQHLKTVTIIKSPTSTSTKSTLWLPINDATKVTRLLISN